MLPQRVVRPKAPPVKCQGIKTKLVPFIASSIQWHGDGRWIEPFLGSGVVAFNIAPKRAVLADTNEHLIRLYENIRSGRITPETVRGHLEAEGSALQEFGQKHYYDIRERFNTKGDPLDFLFLNRSCFNGLIRFNRKGKFNVPFCRKPERFRQAYITRIVNQVAWLRKRMYGKQWTFVCADWSDVLDGVQSGDFVYLDPPYVGRHTDYYNEWSESEANRLAERIKGLPCGFAYSMWKQNRYRENDHIARFFDGYPLVTWEHFYHVGPSEKLRNAMEEALVLSPTHVVDSEERRKCLQVPQTGLNL